MTVEVINETTHQVDAEEFALLAEFVMHQMHVSPAAELSILFVDTEAMTRLHQQWMDLPGPTDVLSFPMDELQPGTPAEVTSEGMLGDVVVCPSVAADQAAAAGHTIQEEMLLLVTHGILHLLGYDHADPEDREVMFALQRRLLLTFLAEAGRPNEQMRTDGPADGPAGDPAEAPRG